MKISSKLMSVFAGTLLLVMPAVHAADSASKPAVEKSEQGRREGGPRGGAGGGMERAVKALELTADQEAKWKTIAEQERAELEALRADKATAQDQKRAKMGDIRKSYSAQRRALLNATQQAKFDEMNARMSERGPGGPGGRKKGKDN